MASPYLSGRGWRYNTAARHSAHWRCVHRSGPWSSRHLGTVTPVQLGFLVVDYCYICFATSPANSCEIGPDKSCFSFLTRSRRCCYVGSRRTLLLATSSLLKRKKTCSWQLRVSSIHNWVEMFKMGNVQRMYYTRCALVLLLNFCTWNQLCSVSNSRTCIACDRVCSCSVT